MMITERYYFTNTLVNIKYPTLWDGFLKYKKIDENEPIGWLDMDNILVDICEINFYINIDKDTIYLSMDRDENYYVHQFEKHIKKVIKKSEEILNIKILSGEFNATEVKHEASQYKYIITCNDDKIILKKRVLNWALLNKSTLSSREEDEIANNIANLKLDSNKK